MADNGATPMINILLDSVQNTIRLSQAEKDIVRSLWKEKKL